MQRRMMAAATYSALFRRRVYLLVVAPLILCAIGAVVLVAAVDPYDVYAWGPAPVLERSRYEPSAQPRLLNVITAQGYDTLIVGGSTAQQFSPDDAEAVLSGTKRAFTLAYSGPKPLDLKVVMDKVAKAPGLRRVLLSYDTSYMFPAHVGRVAFPFALYDEDVTNDARLINLESIALSLRLLTAQEFFLPAWDIAKSERNGDANSSTTAALKRCSGRAP
jgi:hypothetical protein